MTAMPSCPHCLGSIVQDAQRCAHCGAPLDGASDRAGKDPRAFVAASLRVGEHALRVVGGLVGVAIVLRCGWRADLGRNWSIWPHVGAWVGFAASSAWRSRCGEPVTYGTLAYGGLVGAIVVFLIAWWKTGADYLDVRLTYGAVVAMVLMLSGGVRLCLYALRGLPGWDRDSTIGELPQRRVNQ